MHTTSQRGRNLGLIALALMLAMVSIALPLIAHASTFSTGFRVDHSGQTIDENLYIAAFQSTIRADVNGDVTMASVSATIEGTVRGNVHVIAGSTTIRGEVTGSVYIVGGLVRLAGAVDGDIVVIGGRLDINENARVGGDVIIGGAQAQLDGAIDGTVYGSVMLYDQQGRVAGNVELQSDRIQIGSTARIGTDFRYQSGADASIHSGARVSGETVHTNAEPWKSVSGGALAPYGQFARLVWSMLTGAILIVLMPRLFYRASELASSGALAPIWGLLGIVILPILAVIAIVSVFLLPIGILLLLLLPIALYLSQVVIGITIGQAILPQTWRDGSRGFLLMALVLGILIIGILKMAPLPFLNSILSLIITIWGFGALLLSARGATRSEMAL